MNGSFGVMLEGNETPRHREKMLITRCTVSGHHQDLITEQHAACRSPGSWSIIHSQHLTHVPPLQRSKTAKAADRNTYCAQCLCVPHHLSVPAVWRYCFVCVCNFVTNHFPITFWNLRQVGQEKIFFILELALCDILDLHWWHWLLYRFPGIFFVAKILVTTQYLYPSKEKWMYLLKTHFCYLIIHSYVYSPNICKKSCSAFVPWTTRTWDEWESILVFKELEKE